MKKLYFFSVLFFMTNFVLSGKDMSLSVIPVPQKIILSEGTFTFSNKVKIAFRDVRAEDNLQAVEEVRSSLKSAMGLESSCESGSQSAGGISFIIDKSLFDKIPEIKPEVIGEAYRLKVSSEGITISARTSTGLFYGAMTLVQMIDNSKDSALPLVEITDWPDLQFRGISDDISRGQVSTAENFKKIIREIARYKMNVYMPYMEDMLEFKCYPAIGQGRGRLSRAEVKEIVGYAKKFHIEVIPAFQTIGHYENILSQDEFQRYAEFPGSASLCLTYDSTYVFLENMLKEIFEMFPSEYFNMCSDESHDVGFGKSRELAGKIGRGQIHLQHYLKIYDICKKYGKKVIMYGDVILNNPDILPGLPKDIMIVDWHYRPEDEYPSTETFSKAGHKYLVCPSVWNFHTPFPANTVAVPNIKYLTKSGAANGASGMINSNWGDYGSETFKELIYFGYAWSAQCAWNLAASEEGSFNIPYFKDFFGCDGSLGAAIYQSLSNPANFMMWHDVWRHPLLPFREPVWWDPRASVSYKISGMQGAMELVSENIEILEQNATRNRDQIDLLKFIVKLNKWYSYKLETQLLLHKKLAGRDVDNNALNNMVEKNIISLGSLKREYSVLWKRYYKSANLNMIEDKFDRLIAYFRKIKEQSASGPLQPAEIESRWIYAVGADALPGKIVRFCKDFTVTGKPGKSYLQLIADSYARLFINGNYIDCVSAKRSLSLYTEYKRVKMADITPFLREGKNEIYVEVECFNSKGGAGINIIANITDGKGISVLKTDSSWISEENTGGNNSRLSTIEKEYPFTIVAPDFKTLRPSWIER